MSPVFQIDLTTQASSPQTTSLESIKYDLKKNRSNEARSTTPKSDKKAVLPINKSRAARSAERKEQYEDENIVRFLV
mgnify:CR=1 FL=1